MQPRSPIARPIADLIGRDADLARLAMAAQRYRLVTVTGAGGVGKTTLARALAAGLTHTSAMKAWWIDLATVSDGDLVASVFASALQIADGPGPALDRAAQQIGGGEALLLVDNCEHVVDAAADAIRHLLDCCAALHVVATSRAPLEIPGEHRVVVEPLAAEHAQWLFIERAALIDLTTEERTAIAEICRRLDGLPLAIELAATWAAILSPQQMAADLERVLMEPMAVRRGVPERHRSLAATLDWSWTLLQPSEADALSRLALLPADFSLESADAVCGTSSSAAMKALIDRFLLVRTHAGEGYRYRLLEVVREHALSKLSKAQRTESSRRLVDWAVGYVERAAPEQPDESVAYFERELGPIRVALDQAAFSADLREAAALLLVRLRPLWLARHIDEGARRCTSLLQEPETMSDIPLLMLGLTLESHRGEFQTSRALAERALAVSADPKVVSACEMALGRAARWSRDADAALRHHRFAVEAFARTDDLMGYADAQCALGELAFWAGDAKAARESTDAAVAAAGRTGSDLAIQRALVYAGAAAHRRGDLRSAADWLGDALEIGAEGGQLAYGALAHSWAARVATQRGALTEAQRHLEGTRPYAANFFVRFTSEWSRLLLGVEHPIGVTPADLCRLANELVAWGYEALAADLWVGAVHLLLRDGELQHAEACAAQARAAASKTFGRCALGSALLSNALIRATTGDRVGAHGDAQRALLEAERGSDRLTMVDALELLAIAGGQDDVRLGFAAALERDRIGCARPAVYAILPEVPATTADQELDFEQAVSSVLRGRGARIRTRTGPGSLTRTERQVAAHLQAGLTNAEIAVRLSTSPATVKTHVSHILSKLGVRSRAAISHALSEKSPDRPILRT